MKQINSSYKTFILFILMVIVLISANRCAESKFAEIRENPLHGYEQKVDSITAKQKQLQVKIDSLEKKFNN